MGAILLEGEESPLIVVNSRGMSPYVLICEHAGNLMPKALGTLGLDAESQPHRGRRAAMPFAARALYFSPSSAVDDGVRKHSLVP